MYVYSINHTNGINYLTATSIGVLIVDTAHQRIQSDDHICMIPFDKRNVILPACSYMLTC